MMMRSAQHALIHAQRGIAHGRRVAKFAPRALSRCLVRHSLRAQMGHAQVEMHGNFVVDVAPRVAAKELEVPEPFAHDGCSSARSTLLTAPTKLAQDDVSLRSCARPSAVRRYTLVRRLVADSCHSDFTHPRSSS